MRLKLCAGAYLKAVVGDRPQVRRSWPQTAHPSYLRTPSPFHSSPTLVGYFREPTHGPPLFREVPVPHVPVKLLPSSLK